MLIYIKESLDLDSISTHDSTHKYTKTVRKTASKGAFGLGNNWGVHWILAKNGTENYGKSVKIGIKRPKKRVELGKFRILAAFKVEQNHPG